MHLKKASVTCAVICTTNGVVHDDGEGAVVHRVVAELVSVGCAQGEHEVAANG